MKKLLISLAVWLSLTTITKADSVVIDYDTPNVGDVQTTYTYSIGNPATSGNLISQNFIDGTWIGTMFPDSSDLTNESMYMTGKDGKYAETTINSIDHLTLQELQGGFTSVFGADIRWWNPVESTVTMTQTATTSSGDSITQILLLEDTTNHNYVFNPYQNTLIVTPSQDILHGTLTARFDFDIINDAQVNYNKGHAGVDIRSPSLNVTYNTYTENVVVETKYCHEFNPPQCPGQDEIAAAEELIDNLDYSYETIEDTTDIFNINTNIIYDYTDTWEPEEFDLEVTTEITVMDEDLFEIEYFTTDSIQIDQPDEINIEEDFQIDFEIEEQVVFNDELPLISMNEEPIVEENFNQAEFIEEYEPEYNNQDDVGTQPIEEPTTETVNNEDIYVEPNEEIVMAEEPVISTEPTPYQPEEEVYEEEVYEEEIEEIEVVEENAIENEQPVDEEFIPEQPQETAELEEQPIEPTSEAEPEVIDEPVEEDLAEQEEIEVAGKIASIEKAIAEKISDIKQRVEVTLSVVSEILNRDIIQQEVSLASYNAVNESFFENQLDFPDGNMDFFKQIDLVGYDYEIYQQQVSLAVDDPVTAHEIKMETFKIKTEDAYKKLMELKNANNI